jgi:thiamine-phosphate pyrophosphorylase
VKGVPLVAIGGISLEHVSGVMAAGATLVAVVTAVSHAPSPAEMARALLAAAKKGAIDRAGAV